MREKSLTSYIRAKKDVNLNSKGFSMIDMVMALSVSIIVIASVFVFVNKALTDNKVKTEQQHISMLRMAVQELYSGQDDYSTLTNTVAIDAGAYPAPMIKGGSSQSSWNNAAVIVANTNPANTRFTITYMSVPEEAAAKIALYDTGRWVDVRVDGNSVLTNGVAATDRVASAIAGQVTVDIEFTSN